MRADEDGGLVINLARSLAAPCAVVRDSLNTQAVDRYARPGVKRNRIGLGGLLDLLWEQADLNRWDANTKKRWDLKVGKALLDQAEMIRVGRKTMLNEALLLPSVGVKDKPSARSIEHTRNLEVVQNAHQSSLRLVAVAPLANFNAEKDLWAGTDVTAAETEKVLRLGSLGIPRLMMCDSA